MRSPVRSPVALLSLLGPVALLACGGDDDGGFRFDGAVGFDAAPPDAGTDSGTDATGSPDAGPSCAADAVCVRFDVSDFPALEGMQVSVGAHFAWPLYAPTALAAGRATTGETVELRGLSAGSYWIAAVAGDKVAFPEGEDGIVVPDRLGDTVTIRFEPYFVTLQVGRGGNMGEADVVIFANATVFDPMTGSALANDDADVTLVEGSTQTPLPYGRMSGRDVYRWVPDPAARPTAALEYRMRLESARLPGSPVEVRMPVGLLSGPATIISPTPEEHVPAATALRLEWGLPPDASYVIPCVLDGPDFNPPALWGCDAARQSPTSAPSDIFRPMTDYRVGFQSGRTTSRVAGAVVYSVVDSFIYVHTD